MLSFSVAEMQPYSDHESIQRAIKVLYYVFPPLILLFYVVAATISVCTLQTISSTIKDQRAPRTSILWLMAGVVATYIAEATIQITSSFTQHTDIVPYEGNVYAFSSVIVWFILTVSLLDSAYPVWYPYYGSWLLALAAELVFATLPIVYHRPRGSVDLAQLALAVFRMFLLVLLLFLLFGRRYSKARHGPIDEESQPLLAPRHAQDSTEDSGRTKCSGQYGSVSTNGDSTTAVDNASDIDWDAKNKKKEQDARRRVEDRLMNDGNWWTYAKGFSIFIPFIWPSKDRLLQLCMAGVGLCLLAGRALNVLVPRQLGIVTNSLGTNGGHVPWFEVSLYVFYTWLNSGAGIYALKTYLWLPVEQYAYKAISTAAYNHVMNLSSEFHDNKRSGELYQSISLGHSVNNLLETIMFQVLPMLVDLAVAFVYLYYLFDAYMALIVGTVVVIYLWASTHFNAWQVTVRRGLIGNLRKEWQIMYDSVGSWQTVSYFNRVKHEQERYSSAVKGHLKSQRNYTALSYLAQATQNSVLTVGLLGACVLAAYQVVHGAQSIGSFIVLLTYWAQLSGPLAFFGSAYRQISSDFLDAEQLLQLLQYKPTITNRTGARALVLKQGEVEFDNVHFSYDSQRQTLKGITFRAAPGQTVALVGETGGGKSTILKLLFRFYDVAQGTIKIDGQDIRDVTLESLRENIGVVPQDPSLFNETIMSNVRYARLDASDDEVRDACKAAAIHDKIMSFTDGYQSTVGERGVRLSGGELQRIAIARAILKDPNVILLDEATSSVDTETEMHIQEAFRKVTLGRTTFVVAHRLSTIMNADLILVVKSGEILEQGTHDELFRAKGKYYSLWAKQVFVEQSRGRSKSPEKGQEITIINDLNRDPKTQDLLQAASSVPHQHCDGDAKLSASHDQKQETPEGQGKGSLGKEISDVSKEDKGGKGKLSALKGIFWRPDAPEFIPQSLRTTPAQGGQPTHQQKGASYDRSHGHLVSGQESLETSPEFSGMAKEVIAISKNGNNVQETSVPEVPTHAIDERENSPGSGKTEKEKKRRWRKRKSREIEPSEVSSASVFQSNLQEEAAINQAAQLEGNGAPANKPIGNPKSKDKRPRLNRRAQSKSEPAGHGRSQTDGTSEIELKSSGSTNDQPMNNTARRVSAPSDPPSGPTVTRWSKNGRRRRRRHWRDQNGEASGAQSTQSTASWATDSPYDGTGTPTAPVTSPATGVKAVNGSYRVPSGSGVRFAPGS